MQRALVLGASGGMGYSIAKELSSRGVMVTAFARTQERLEKLFAEDENITICSGNLFSIDDLDKAAKNVDVIFQSSNIPYVEWQEKLPILISNILKIAEKNYSKLAIVDNIYAYGKSVGKTSESTIKKPHTKKGKIRLEIENLVKKSKVPSLIVHFPDFYGPNAENTILNYTLINIVKNKSSSYVGNKKVKREFIYTPDGAKAIVDLSLQDKAYGQNWNIPGYNVISGEEIIDIIRDITGYRKGVSTVSKNMIRFMGLFNRQMREVVEMFYLNEEPVVLDGEKYEKLIGPVPRTSYHEGLRQTIEYMEQNTIRN